MKDSHLTGMEGAWIRMSDVREKHELVLENQQLRQIIAATIVENNGEPLSIHMSSLHMCRGSKLDVKHVADEASIKITLIDDQLIGEPDAG